VVNQDNTPDPRPADDASRAARPAEPAAPAAPAAPAVPAAPAPPAATTPGSERVALPAAALETTTGPHLSDRPFTTRRMMVDVLIGLLPLMVAGIWFFRQWAVIHVLVAAAFCLATEWVFNRARKKPMTLADGSVIVTAVILAFSLPPRVPIYATAIGSVVAVALGKMVFGGLGYNLFNPAMVGRAFLMACFPVAMTTWSAPGTLDAMTGATPLAAAKFSKIFPADLMPLITGNVGGCIGETSAAMVLLGGLWLLLRGSADWRLTVGTLIPVVVIGAIQSAMTGGQGLGPVGHLAAGSVLFGAFFIVTDPVTTPLTRAGRWIYGLATGALIMVIRLFAGYPEGVMYAVLVVNAFSPLINRWTQTRPVGGHVRPAA